MNSFTSDSIHAETHGRTLFLEIPEIQPVNQLHLHLRVDAGPAQDLFATVHKLGPPFGDFPGYRSARKQVHPHPILADLARATKAVPNPWRKPLPGARALTLEAGKNLTFATREFRVRAGEPLRLTFSNPDAVPHNWVLLKPDTLERVGDLTNKIIMDPDAAVRHYVPQSDDVLVFTDIVEPLGKFTIHFRAPTAKGRYPYLCTFPGHWMVMNGQMMVD